VNTSSTPGAGHSRTRRRVRTPPLCPFFSPKRFKPASGFERATRVQHDGVLVRAEKGCFTGAALANLASVRTILAAVVSSAGLAALLIGADVGVATAQDKSRSTALVIRGDRNIAGVPVLSRLARATAVLGAPNTMRRVSKYDCRTVWRPIGLTLGYLDLSGGDPCRLGGMVTATATSTAWRTDRGLRIGDRVAHLRLLYPRAKRVALPPYGGWWLITRHTCATTGSQAYPGLRARASATKVLALTVTVAACE
jgi:hypothetical protein